MNHRVEHQRDQCIACGNCVSAAPEYWEMASDGLAMLKGSTCAGNLCTKAVEDDVELEAQNMAAAVCPVGVIKVVEE